jgi:clusterin-associated protein 1
MDEYEKIETELVQVYEKYMTRFRNITYLEQQVDEQDREEREAFEENESTLRQMQSRLRDEELRLLREDKDENTQSSRPNRPSGIFCIYSSCQFTRSKYGECESRN